MISCKNLSKCFGKQIVLNSFSYNFNDTGFYLLFGESGSGKTTLLNTLAGFLPFDSGNITYNERSFLNKVDNSLIANDFDYITQDAFFVDFLSVMDNMRLISNNDEEIIEKLKEFNLDKKIHQMPTTLSGGEKQRLSIVRALINNKKVLFLDEPTASLDNENKTSVFELLSQLKEHILIICSSHDVVAKNYADEIIHFSKNKNETLSNNINQKNSTCYSAKKSTKNHIKSFNQKESLNYFLKQWFNSNRRNKKASILFTFFLILSMCICVFADTPQNKLETSIEQMYKLNVLTITTKNKTRWENIAPSTNEIKEIVLNYGRSCPNGSEKIDTDSSALMIPGQEHEVTLNVIPSAKENFKLSDKIIYGTYFTDKYQVILSSEMANALYPNAPEKLIGEKITKTIYGLGKTDLKIVGIFDYFNDFEKMYLNAIDVDIAVGNSYNAENYSNLFFVNSDLISELENDDSFYMGKGYQRSYNLYFNSYKSMKNFYDDYSEKLNSQKNVDINYSNFNGNLYDVFRILFYTMLPISFFTIIFATLFFITLKKAEYVYNNKFIAVFEYSGWKKEKVIDRFILLNILELIKHYAIAAVATFLVTYIVNLLNKTFVFVNFQIFSYNIFIILFFLVFLIICTLIFVTAIFKKVKVSSWYENLITGRDLI